MEFVRQFGNRSIELGHNSMVKEAAKFGQELGFELTFVYPNPVCRNDEDGEEIPGAKIKKKGERSSAKPTQRKDCKPEVTREVDCLEMEGPSTKPRLLQLVGVKEGWDRVDVLERIK